MRLSQVIAKAVQAVYVAKTKHDQAVKDGRDSTLSVVALAEARKTEREAVKDLEAHRKEHQCQRNRHSYIRLAKRPMSGCIRSSEVARPICDEYLRLSREVARAAHAAYEAKKDYERALRQRSQ
jgi:hypothetical protein